MLTCPPATPSTYQTAHQPTTKPVTAKAMVRTGTGKTTGEAAVIGGDKGGRHVFCHGASATTTFATSQAPAKAMVKSATAKATAEATSNKGGNGDRLSHCRGADASKNAASDRWRTTPRRPQGWPSLPQKPQGWHSLLSLLSRSSCLFLVG